MKRNQRTKYDYTTDYNRSKPTKLESGQLQLKPKQTQSTDLKSLECSSVHEVQPTNQSYEMSWLEKLVNNMDQDKQNNTYAEHPSRNFTRKNSINFTSNYIPQKTNDTNKKNGNSSTKYENQYTPISKINEIATLPRNQKYHVNQFKDSQNQRFTRKYLNSAEKYQLQRKYSSINPINYQAKQLNKDVDLNQSTQSYGRIKKINKQKQNNQIHSKYLFPENLEEIQIPSAKPYLANYRRQQKDRDRIATQNPSSANFYSYKPSYDVKDYLKQNSYKSYEKPIKNQFDILKRKDSTYIKVGEEKPNYQSLSYKQKYESPIKMSYEYKQQLSGGQTKQTNDKLGQKEDDFKMDEMAKKLNMVLQNINKKSKMIAQPHQESISKSTTSFSNSTNTTTNFESKTELQPRKSSYIKQGYIRGSQNIWQKRQKAQQIIRKQQPPSIDTKQTLSSSINNYCRSVDTTKPNLPSLSPSSTPNSSYHLVQTIQREHQKQQTHQNKYQMMKKSLGMSKHIPHEIILQQSSSQINSQVTPRTQFLNHQLRIIFDKLDKNKTGELNKNNCGLQQISDEIKYIFGGIFSKIKYKGQKILFKGFLEQCQNIIKQFQFSELKQVFCKSNNVPYFQYHQKEVQSQKWNNQTNNDIQSKRSSDRSQVVKKYDFTQENIQGKYKSQNQHQLKIHWVAPMYRHTDVLNVEQISKQKKRETSKSPYQPKRQIRQQKYLEVKDDNKKLTYTNTNQAKTQIKTYLQEKSLQKQHITIEKQNSKTSQTQKEKKDFQKMCQNLNNKLNNYLTTITKKVSSTGPHIPLEFSQLSKHWNITKS